MTEPAYDIRRHDKVHYGNNGHVWTVAEIVDRPKPRAVIHRLHPVEYRTDIPLCDLLLIHRPKGLAA
jgi:hypothetical protein